MNTSNLNKYSIGWTCSPDLEECPDSEFVLSVNYSLTQRFDFINFPWQHLDPKIELLNSSTQIIPNFNLMLGFVDFSNPVQSIQTRVLKAVFLQTNNRNFSAPWPKASSIRGYQRWTSSLLKPECIACLYSSTYLESKSYNFWFKATHAPILRTTRPECYPNRSDRESINITSDFCH